MTPRIRPMPDSMSVAFLRVVFVLSIMPDATASKMETELVSAAKSTIKKKMEPKILPAKPISANTLGSATNISPGPALDKPSLPRNT